MLLAFSFTSLRPWLRCLGVCPFSTLYNTFLLLLGFWPSWAVGLVPTAGSRSRRCVRWVRSPLVWSCPGPAAWLGWSSLEVLFLAPSLLRLLLRCGGLFALFCFLVELSCFLSLGSPRSLLALCALSYPLRGVLVVRMYIQCSVAFVRNFCLVSVLGFGAFCCSFSYWALVPFRCFCSAFCFSLGFSSLVVILGFCLGAVYRRPVTLLFFLGLSVLPGCGLSAKSDKLHLGEARFSCQELYCS